MIEPWPKIGSKPLADYRVFSVRSEARRSPRTGAEHDFFVIDAASWVNVIALTPAGQIILVEQFRHGSETVELEIPGGVMDPGDAWPEATAVRELREETGYTGERPRIIGQVFANPAIMSNTVFTVLMENCWITAPPQFDPAEEIVTKLVNLHEVPRLVAEGKIRHSLVVAALFHFELWRVAQTSKI